MCDFFCCSAPPQLSAPHREGCESWPLGEKKVSSPGESIRVLEQKSGISAAFHGCPCCSSGLVQGLARVSPGDPWSWNRNNVKKDNVAAVVIFAICIFVCKFMSAFKLKKRKLSYQRAFLGSFLNDNVCRRFNISHKLKKLHLVPEMLYNILRREVGKNIA